MNIRVAESFLNIVNCWFKCFISLKLFKQLSIIQLVEKIKWDLNVKSKISMYWMSLKHGCQDWIFQLFTYQGKVLKKVWYLSFENKIFPSLIRVYLFKVIFYGKVYKQIQRQIQSSLIFLNWFIGKLFKTIHNEWCQQSKAWDGKKIMKLLILI